ncbi:lauroyl-Kdo(2)-lipid IV(A) myristoyltransferase [Vibrio sp. DW001]|uniref:lauroyl-Kdo(2)-lipid IV(A) myristoyltransferase n=1 Tax=Vibrio sp. DW001 TaxID=2912315 RepID=UPI0023B16C52|nr:lauroyl-Kdo(2)-lipid IV(A) myristoyltransferase [Vibrio sp. DW001]WED28297.1 lauroyl-Kdo(2)-lipid IV(A) myristoyltransferase [Vibrio sp. DW001]
MMKQREDFNPDAYNPTFKWIFLSPKYWGTWSSILIVSLVSLFPAAFKFLISKFLARIAIKIKNKANKRARVNLKMCFPDISTSEREVLLFNTYVTSISFLLNFASLSLKSKGWLENNTTINGIDNLTCITEQGGNVILLVPHTWSIDIPAVLLASRGLPVSAMAKAQKNQVSDWLLHKQRVQYGGRVYDRSQGIKPFIRSIRDGYLGYYLPDEDLGLDNSVFVDFFATTKATISGLGRLSHISRAKIVPLFATYNAKSGRYQLDLYPALPFPTGNEHDDARMMNQCIEEYVNKKPEQYMWILRLLKTRPDTDKNPYK